MSEEAYQIFDYLPLSFRSPQEQEYINFLWSAFESNYQNGNYQFAFLAYHMLYMSFVYFMIWQIKNNRTESFNHSLIGFQQKLEKDILNATTPFTFSLFHESNVFRFFKLVGCDNANIGNYEKLVENRNKIAHTNGVISITDQDTADQRILEVLKLVDEIHLYSKCVIEDCYKKFLVDNSSSKSREFIIATDQINELLIHKNYLSRKGIQICFNFDIEALTFHPGYNKMKSLHNAVVKEYKTKFEE